MGNTEFPSGIVHMNEQRAMDARKNKALSGNPFSLLK